MKIIRLFILLMLFSGTSLIDAAPSFECQKAKTDIEKAICKNEFVSDLDQVLDTVYKKALKRSRHPEKIKIEQIKWMKNRPNFDKRIEAMLRPFEKNPAIMKEIVRIEREISWRKNNNPHLQKSAIENLEDTVRYLKNRNRDPESIKSQRTSFEKRRPTKGSPDYEQKLISELEHDYLKRIDELLSLKNEKLCSFFLEEFLKNPGKVNQNKADKILVCLAIISFLEQIGDEVGHDFLDELIDDFHFTKFTPNKVLVLLRTSGGAYSQWYKFYTIDKKTDALKMKPYILSDHVGPPCSDGKNWHHGDFSLDLDNKKIGYCTRPVSYEAGDCMTWKLTEHCGVLIEKRVDVKSSG